VITFWLIDGRILYLTWRVSQAEENHCVRSMFLFVIQIIFSQDERNTVAISLHLMQSHSNIHIPWIVVVDEIMYSLFSYEDRHMAREIDRESWTVVTWHFLCLLNDENNVKSDDAVSRANKTIVSCSKSLSAGVHVTGFRKPSRVLTSFVYTCFDLSAAKVWWR